MPRNVTPGPLFRLMPSRQFRALSGPSTFLLLTRFTDSLAEQGGGLGPCRPDLYTGAGSSGSGCRATANSFSQAGQERLGDLAKSRVQGASHKKPVEGTGVGERNTAWNLAQGRARSRCHWGSGNERIRRNLGFEAH